MAILSVPLDGWTLPFQFTARAQSGDAPVAWVLRLPLWAVAHPPEVMGGDVPFSGEKLQACPAGGLVL